MRTRGRVAIAVVLLLPATPLVLALAAPETIGEPLSGKVDAFLQRSPWLPTWRATDLAPEHASSPAAAALGFTSGARERVDLDWVYHGTRYHWTVTADAALYADFSARERVLDARLYGTYVSTPDDDEVIERLARDLDAIASARGFSRLERANFLLAFVQGLPYVSDSVVSPQDDYPKYPIETLVEQGGDCEDTSILYVSLLRALGEEAVLLYLPGHMAAGVRLPGSEEYRFAEVSSPGWRVGEIPWRLRGKEVTPVHLDPRPLLAHHWRVNQESDGSYRFRVAIENHGTGPSEDLVVNATAASNAMPLKVASRRLDTIPPGGRVETSLKLHVPEAEGVRFDIELDDPASGEVDRTIGAFRLAAPIPF